MAIIHNSRPATGGPGIAPRWTRGAKDAVGTAYSVAASIWFTSSAGILNEIYYPTIDRPQTRDLQLLVTDGKTFFRDERSMVHEIDYIDRHALGLKITNSDPEHGYRIVKEVIVDPHQECVLINAHLEGEPEKLKQLRLFVLVAPHLEGGGANNNGNVVESSGREILTAHKNNTWLAMDVTSGFLRKSCGYVGTTDGWQDLSDNFELDNDFDCALDGNIALVGEINLSRQLRIHSRRGLRRQPASRDDHPVSIARYPLPGVPRAIHRAMDTGLRPRIAAGRRVGGPRQAVSQQSQPDHGA